jgi:hypothetical protein
LKNIQLRICALTISGRMAVTFIERYLTDVGAAG